MEKYVNENYESNLCEAHSVEYEKIKGEVIMDKTELKEDTVLVQEEGLLSQEEVDEGLKAFDEQSTPKTRLEGEIRELSDKIDRLSGYLKRRDVDGVRLIVKDGLTDAAVYLLHHQLEVMQEYYNILCARYSIFDVKKD